MSCRGGGPGRAGNQGPQPVRATVPFQLQNRAAPRHKDGRAAECKTKGRPPKPTLRRTLSLDTVVGPYLQGHWPKEPEPLAISCVNDKATQTPSSWVEQTRGRRGSGGHKRSASWGSAEHLREVAKLRQSLQKRCRHAPAADQAAHTPGGTQTTPLIPLSRLAPRLRRSVEGLNLELEGVFVSETAKGHHKILDVPDGHRAPVPAAQRCQLSPSHSEPDMAACGPLCPPCSPLPGLAEPPSSSPRPNKTHVFQREPPEGCEKVRVSDEAFFSSPRQPSCPDPNKVNFTPHGGSAFCPVSLLKPLLPSMDLLFRGLSVSPITACPTPVHPSTAPL